MTDLTGQRVLVIGGGKNLGLALARKAKDLGATVAIGVRSAQEVADTVGEEFQIIPLDITDEASIAAAAAELGTVDHIVSTAAAHHNVPVADLDKAATLTAFDAKVVGPLLVAKHFDVTGSIVLFSGVAAWRPSPGYAVMGITNGAVAFAVSHLAKELAPVRVNAVSPGIIDSGTYDAMPAADRQAFFAGVAEGNLAGRVGTTDDIVDAVAWLWGAGFVSGETIHVEGGVRAF
ncbi:SDR family oxidoreductase [Branchiibius sp. NY16-3462-2]|uniref:SDR family oxidoreductase n=1 Tax=Branchiibius sp. NY16-3462-2 TaxID=1807500 RepID=UPI00079B93F9|nr:SDR family oxidoreductase [Branchiibius sp. NY16-3462-2]KYH44883.1 short-chain dehydrogenase [Branchiibius sp. NY16-3462-2]